MRSYTITLSLILVIIVMSALSGCITRSVTTISPDPETTVTVTVVQPAASSTVTTPLFPVPPSPVVSVAPVLPALADVIAQVRPAVVAINTATAVNFFGRTFNQEGAGSGWIIKSDGLIVTNAHVVANAEVITVTLEDNRNYPVINVWTDPVSDVAVVRIDADGLPVARLGDSSTVRVGDWVIAIGNSLGYGIRASSGIVSARGVSLEADNGEIMYDLLQTDAAINPGNSGGPLVNLAGEVIGINSIKIVQTGVEGISYAISSQDAMPLINELIANGFVARPSIGAQFYEVDEFAVDQLDLSVDKGVLLVEVLRNGPADKAGMQQFDVITLFDGQEVNTVQNLLKLIRERKIGDTVPVTCWRGDVQNNMEVTLELSPPPA